MVLAPASIASSITSHKNFKSDLPASSGENSTSSVNDFANLIALIAVFLNFIRSHLKFFFHMYWGSCNKSMYSSIF